MEQRFKCKTPECDQEVVYEREVVPGVAFQVPKAHKDIVYLTCPRGHINPYEVTVE
jgi:hypothetical protein